LRSQREIEKSMQQLFVSLQDKVTTYAKGSVIRALFIAISAVLADAWNEIVQVKRKSFPDTATGTDLDARFSELGFERRGAVAVSTICVFSSNEVVKSVSTSVGTNVLNDTVQNWTVNKYAGWKLYDGAGQKFTIASNTATQIVVTGYPVGGTYYIFPIVPANTAILSSRTGKRYLTTEEVIVGLSNPELLGQSSDVALGNRTIVTCDIAGNEGQAQTNELTLFETPIAGVSGVTNPIPTQPRTSVDEESDDAFRNRVRLYIATLNIGTQAFYESLAVRGNEKTLRSTSIKDNSGKIIVYVATRSGELLTETELANLATYIYDRSKAFDTVECQNMVMTDIFVNYEAFLPSEINIDSYYVAIADVISNYLDYAVWKIEDKIIDDDILVKIKSVNQTIDIDLSTFTVEASKSGVFDNSKVITLNNSLPRFARLRFKDTNSNTIKDIVLSSYPIAQINNSKLNPYKFRQIVEY
jgi:uncharacterized phage protein gp47/JayE